VFQIQYFVGANDEPMFFVVLYWAGDAMADGVVRAVRGHR
jgi:hypothetical protein